MATKLKENQVRMKCGVCGRITNYTKRNKKKIQEKLQLSKYCKFCRKHETHKEMK